MLRQAPDGYEVQELTTAYQLENQTFFIAPGHTAPLTLREVELYGIEDASPVGITVHHEAGFAVAWDATSGEPMIGHRASILGAWRLENIQPIYMDLNQTEESSEARVADGTPVYEIPLNTDAYTPDTARDVAEADTSTINIEWLDDVEEWFVEFLELAPRLP